jgi:hypothetical protein
MARRFSGSTIKAWFQYRCERKTRYELSSDEELATVPIVRDVRERPWAIKGIQYEDQVVEALARSHPIARPVRPKTPLNEQITVAFLRGQLKKSFAAQANLTPRIVPEILSSVGLGLNRNLPDLIRHDHVDGRHSKVFTIIDIKGTRKATPFHKTQVAFYAWILEEYLKELGEDISQIDDHGEIWRIPDKGTIDGSEYQVDRFPLRPYARLVKDFCQTQLPMIAAKKVVNEFDETFFHLYFKCEQCAYLEHCLGAIDPSRPAELRDISAVPGLTHESKRALLRLGIKNVKQLSEAKSLANFAGASWSLSRQAPVLATRASALVSNSILRTAEEHSYLIPPRADVIFLISVDHDPIADRISAIGYRRLRNFKMEAEHIEIPAKESAQHEADALISVLTALIADLTSIDAENASRPQSQGTFVHIFFYEPAEANNLQQAVGRHLENEIVRGGLLHMVRLFPPDDVVPEPEFRGIHHLPATAVRSVIEQLFALPVTVSHDLRQVSAALAADGAGPAYTPSPQFARPFSSLLSVDVIRGLRENLKNAASIAEIEVDVKSRLEALSNVVRWLYAKNQTETANGQPLFRLAKKPFQFQATFNPLNIVDLDVLTACELLEDRAGLLSALVNLAQPFERRRDAGRCLAKLRLIGPRNLGPRKIALKFSIPDASRVSELGPANFDLILTDNSPDLRLDSSRWGLVACRILPHDDDASDGANVVQIVMDRAVYNGPIMQALLRTTPADGWFIDQSFSSINTARAVDFFANLATGQ